MTDEQIRAVLDRAVQDMTSWYLAAEIGMDQATVDDLGYAMYDRLGDAFGIDPDGLSARVIVLLLGEIGGHEKAARSALKGLNALLRDGEVPA